MRPADAWDVQHVLTFFLDPAGDVDDIEARGAIMRLAEAAYKRVGGLEPNRVRALADDLIAAVAGLDRDGRAIEDVPVGEVL
jgi:hypothetical protein